MFCDPFHGNSVIWAGESCVRARVCVCVCARACEYNILSMIFGTNKII